MSETIPAADEPAAAVIAPEPAAPVVIQEPAPVIVAPVEPETVTVISRLAHGLRIALPGDPVRYSQDDDRLVSATSAENVIVLAGANAGGLTEDVPAAAFRQWLSDHADHDAVSGGLISIRG